MVDELPEDLNLAALADLRYTVLIFSGYGETTENVGPDGERRTYRTLLPNIRLALPLRSARLAAFAGTDEVRLS